MKIIQRLGYNLYIRTVNLILEYKLEKILNEIGKAVVLLSGGADSAYLASVAKKVLGDNAYSLTVVSPLLASDERDDVRRLVSQLGLNHTSVQMNELADENFAANPDDKCYICKKLRLQSVVEWAKENNIPWILDGSNMDDLSDYRPGMKAMKEFDNVRSPFIEAGITKSDIRRLSKQAGLFTWEKPAAACLASRIARHQNITEERLAQVEGAESFLRSILPPHSQFRVRHHGEIARIEAEISFLPMLISNDTNGVLRKLGFKHVALDLAGYETGSLNP